MISKRSRNIILEICKQNNRKTSDLAKIFKVSERTIRMDLDEIDYFLKENGFEPLVRTKKGCCLSEANLQTSLIYKLINQKDIVTASYTKEERLLEILYILCMQQGTIKLEALAEALLVSKSTIVKDLERLKMMIMKEPYQLHGSLDGIALMGDEAAIRSCVVKMFMETMDKQAVADLIHLINGSDEIITYKVYWRLFEHLPLDDIVHDVEVMKAMLSIHVSDDIYLQVLANICIMLKRVRIHKAMPVLEHSYRSHVSQHGVETMYAIMQREYGLPESEKGYLQYILYLVSPYVYEMEHLSLDSIYHEFIVSLIDAVSEIIEYEHPEKLLQDIEQDVKAMVMEDQLYIPVKRHVIELQSPLYQALFDEVSKHVDWLTFQHHSLNEDDIWRMTWHFLANQKEHVKASNVLIVSDKPLSLIHIMMQKLRRLFNVEIVGICGLAQFDKYISAFSVDCIVSTMKIHTDIDVVRVHPLLSEENIADLKQHLQTHQVTIDETLHQPFKRYHETLEEQDFTSILRYMNQHLQTEKVINIPIFQGICADFEKQHHDFMIREGVLYLNIRNHEIINQNYVMQLHLRHTIVLDHHEVHAIILVASMDAKGYIQYIESIL